MKSFEREVLEFAQMTLKNPKLKWKDVLDCSTGEIEPKDETEVVVHIQILRVNICVKVEADKRFGKTCTKEQFLSLLDTLRAEVAKDGSREGRLDYEWGDKPDTYRVAAFIRIGNDEGQGGAIFVQKPAAFTPVATEDVVP